MEASKLFSKTEKEEPLIPRLCEWLERRDTMKKDNVVALENPAPQHDLLTQVLRQERTCC